MADLVHLSLASGPDPQLSGHFATKAYVDTARSQATLTSVSGNATLSTSAEVVRVTGSSGATITVPTNSSVPFPVGTRRWIRRAGTADVSVVGAGGVTVNWPGGDFVLTTQYAVAEVVKVGTDTWDGVLIGN